MTTAVRAVILDWAGTAVDHGSLAPVGVFVEVFRREGLEVTLAQARAPMGTHKREHIRRMTVDPNVREAWRAVRGSDPTDADVDRMYDAAGPLQMAVLPRHAEPIAGVVETVAALRERGVRIGSTTGYTREMLDVLVKAAAERGYRPEVHVAATEVPEGRPAPFLAWTAAMRLGAWPARACVKVGDTVPDIDAGRNAGMWTVGVAATGNLVGLSVADLGALDAADRERRVEAARATLRAAGAHYVVDSVADLLPVIDAIETRLTRGEQP